VLSNGTITTVAGTGTGGYNNDNILATNAELKNPNGVALDTNGNIYIADSGNNRIRKVFAVNSTIITIAGTGTGPYNGDGILATNATLQDPRGVAVDTNGNIYIAETGNNRIRKVLSNGTITTVAGTGTGGYNNDNILATSAELNKPYGVALDTIGDIYIADGNNNRIRKVLSNGTITTVAGNGTGGYNNDNILATSAELNKPYGVALDTIGDIYIADTLNNRIRKVLSNGTITTVAGTGTGPYNNDNILATSANLLYPAGVALDTNGNIYIADTDNYRIRKIYA
jgi:sugar lactone lactonase YvrE